MSSAFHRKFRNQVASWESLFIPAAEACAKHRELWDRHFPQMGFSYKESLVYNAQLQVFWKTFWHIEARIRPIIRELKLGHNEQILPALAYLAVPRRHFRSGYNKEQILQALKHVELSAKEQTLVYEIWNELAGQLSNRERRKYVQLLSFLDRISIQ